MTNLSWRGAVARAGGIPFLRALGSRLKMKKSKWLWVAVSLAAVVAISFGLAYAFNRLLDPLKDSLNESDQIAYLIVFASTLGASLTIVAPVPVAAAIMVTAATIWNPVLVALIAATGGTLGELSGYYAGYMGRNTVLGGNIDKLGMYQKMKGWMDRHAFWTLSFLAFQPVLPIDIGGLIAGSSRVPLWRFLSALWVGKFPKFIIICYSGKELINFLPG